MTFKDITQFLLAKVQSQLAYILSVLMAFLLIWQIVDLATLFHVDESSMPASFMRLQAIEPLPKMAEWHLFGFAKNVLNFKNLIETNLPLTLVGTFISSAQTNSQVVITKDGQDTLYSEGDSIFADTKIFKIFPNYIVLKRDQHFEMLSLPRDNLVYAEAPVGIFNRSEYKRV